MEISKLQQIGSLNIAQAVIEKAVTVAVDEVDGVAALMHAPRSIAQILRGAKPSPIGLTVVGGVACIDVYVLMKPEHQIKKATKAIQTNVKETVQSMTGIAVSRVNIFVCGIEE